LWVGRWVRVFVGRLVGKSLWVGWWVRVCGLVGEGFVGR